MKSGGESLAKTRWKLLGEALLTSRRNEVRRDEIVKFPSYGFIQSFVASKAEKADVDKSWFEVTTKYGGKLKISMNKSAPSKSDLTGFNNTGNVCIWPAEECLAIFCAQNQRLTSGKNVVVELGSGMTGLAGLFLARHAEAKPKKLILTDGNDSSVANLSRIVEENDFAGCEVEARKLLWNADDCAELRERVDVVLSSDCLFFDEFRTDLRDAIFALLKPEGGRAVLVAPKRGKSFADFVELAKERFSSVQVVEDYCDEISERRNELRSDPRFDPDTQYPSLILLEKNIVPHSRL